MHRSFCATAALPVAVLVVVAFGVEAALHVVMETPLQVAALVADVAVEAALHVERHPVCGAFLLHSDDH